MAAGHAITSDSRGFARQTDALEITAAATAKPVVVLKRPVGSDDEFKENVPLRTIKPSCG